jgi:translation initiation factor 1
MRRDGLWRLHRRSEGVKVDSMTDRVVYSTEQGKMCPDCRQPVAGCICKRSVAVAASSGVVRVSRETKGRKGKGVTLVQGVALDPGSEPVNENDTLG